MSSQSANPAAGTRRAEHAEDSRRSILAAARRAFARRGFADTTLEDIVGPARLTKGALYHHFKSKAAVFEALYVAMEEDLMAAVGHAIAAAGDDPWARTVAALEAFFAGSADPDYVRIVLRDAPHVLGREHGREIDQAIALGFVIQLVEGLRAEGLIPPLSVTATARMLLATTGELAITMASADDPVAARREGLEVMRAVLEGLRAIAGSSR